MLEPPKENAKVQRAYMLYEFDIAAKETYFRVDLTVERDGEAIGTPRPPMYLARLQSNKPLEVPKRDESLTLRNFSCCFFPLNPESQKSNETLRTVYCPYRPATPEWKQLARELVDYPDVLAVDYTGETHRKNFEDFL